MESIVFENENVTLEYCAERRLVIKEKSRGSNTNLKIPYSELRRQQDRNRKAEIGKNKKDIS